MSCEREAHERATGSASKPAVSGSGASGPRELSRRGGARPVPVRRARSGRLAQVRRTIRRAWRRTLATTPLWLALFVLAATWSLLPRPLRSGATPAAVGDVATQTVVAERDLVIPDQAATLALEEAARLAVLPVFDLDQTLEDRRAAQVAELFRAGRVLLAAESGTRGVRLAPAERLARLREASRLRLSAEQEALLYARGYDAQLEQRLRGEISRVLSQGVVSDQDLLLEYRARGITVQTLPSGHRRTELDLYRYLDYPDEVREAVARDLELRSDQHAGERALLVDLLVANLSPNLTPNNSETLELGRRAAADVGTVTRNIPQGQVVVRKGDRVDAIAALALAALAGRGHAGVRGTTGLGTVLLLAALVLVLWLGLRSDLPADRPRSRLLSELLLLLFVHVLGVRFSFFVAQAIGNAGLPAPVGDAASYQWGIPFAGLAMIVSLLYGRSTALTVSLVFSLLAGRLAGGDASWPLTVFSLAGSLAAIDALERLHFKQRSVIATAGLMVGMINALAVLALTALSGRLPSTERLGIDLLCAFAGGLLAAAITSFVVPVLESLFGATTHIKLIELANPNLPLLRRLALEAPGTFQHSLAVANLAKAGCEAIDADAVLVNTCALYHDIGKVVRPLYFIENQAPGQNPHDKVQPSMSALILINHVKDGLELAEEHRLPAPIAKGIAQHHGTRLITFFHRRALERMDPDTEAVSEDNFRYPGPKPQTKEMGVLMLADAVEAASRTLVEPSRQQIRTMVRQILDRCLADRELDCTDLTLGDLRQIEEAFLTVLTTIYHRRIDYPGFDFNRPRRKRAAAGVTAPAGSERRAS